MSKQQNHTKTKQRIDHNAKPNNYLSRIFFLIYKHPLKFILETKMKRDIFIYLWI